MMQAASNEETIDREVKHMSDIKNLNDDALAGVAGGRQSNLSIAYEVIDGKWGNGQERINRLTAAGYDFNTIQDMVNEILKHQPKPPQYRDPYLG